MFPCIAHVFFLTIERGKALINWANQSRPLAELEDGISYLGGQQVNVTRVEQQVWVNQPNGCVFSANPGTYHDGFEAGVARLREIAARVSVGPDGAAREIHYLHPLIWCYICPRNGHPTFHDLYGDSWCDLAEECAAEKEGKVLLPLPNEEGSTLALTINGRKGERRTINVVPGSGVMLSDGYQRHREMRIFDNVTLPLARFKRLNPRQGKTLFECQQLSGVPRAVIEQSLFCV